MPNLPNNFVPYWTIKNTQLVDDYITNTITEKIIFKKPHLGKNA